MDTLKRKEQTQIIEQFRNLSWSTIFSLWEKTLNSFGVTADNIFLEVNIFTELADKRNSELSWWPKSELTQIKHELISHIDRLPQFIGPIHGRTGLQSGEITTIQLLWEARHTPEQIAAILICASLRSRKRNYPAADWPSADATDELYNIVRERWGLDESYSPWHAACTNVTPITNRDFEYQISSTHTFIRYLATEHCKLLGSQQAVHIVFNLKPE